MPYDLWTTFENSEHSVPAFLQGQTVLLLPFVLSAVVQRERAPLCTTKRESPTRKWGLVIKSI